jgi:predicted enzyme related to lactoylglutathione lyase
MLSTPQGAGAVGENSILYFGVGDIDSTYAALLGRGASDERRSELTARMPDHELWTAFIRDPDGNVVGLMEERW